MHIEHQNGSVTVWRPTTREQLCGHGILLSEEPSGPLRMTCIAVPLGNSPRPALYTGFYIEMERSGEWESIMADLPEEDHDANCRRVEALFALTKDEWDQISEAGAAARAAVADTARRASDAEK